MATGEHAAALHLLSLHCAAAAAVPQAFVHSDCPYTLEHLLRAFARRGAAWRVATRASLCAGAGPPPLPQLLRSVLWVDEYEHTDWGTALAPPYRLVSNFCIRKGLGRKGNLAEAMEAYFMRHSDLRAALGRCFPCTVVLDTFSTFHARPRWLDEGSALAEALFEAEAAMASAPRAAWILKPSLTNKGAGLSIVTTFAQVEAELRRERELSQWVLQRYLRRSLLLLPLRRGAATTRHKFHVRLYAAAVGALEVHVYREALLLVAPEAYDGSALGRTAAHITNTCVSQGSAAFEEALHVRCLSELPGLLAGAGGLEGAGVVAGAAEAAVAGLFADMCTLTAHCFAAQEGRAAGFQPLPLGWELYGIDFLVAVGEEEEMEGGGGGGAAAAAAEAQTHSPGSLGQWRAVLLEFNPCPDVRQTGDRLDGLIGGMLEGLLQVALDERVAGGQPPPGEVELGAHISLTPEGGGAGVRVCTAPRRAGGMDAGGVVARAALPVWFPGCSGCALPVQLPARPRHAQHHSSGFDCVYSKLWPSAHNALVSVT